MARIDRSFDTLAAAAAAQNARVTHRYVVEFWTGDDWTTTEAPTPQDDADVDALLRDSGDLWGKGARVTKITRENGKPYDAQDVTREALERTAAALEAEHNGNVPAEFAWIMEAAPQDQVELYAPRLEYLHPDQR